MGEVGMVVGPPSFLQTHVCRMDLTSSCNLTWGRFLNKFRSFPTSLWSPPAKSSAPCACSETWVHFRENFTKHKITPDERRARLQADEVRHSLARAAETPEQYQARLQSQQVRQNAPRAAETPEQRQSRNCALP
ncbi:hypothetical protein TNIN_240321 [Trichonephila inaurata madagascariensis]|uniref:Uncharacterized protein n=1 Tax=Trichonephila inaurata madagascariensis TaxID=2747483 RepID=A0A8X6J5I6_9ARAC|nr:hypothetical protein TNIN_240321 [Trichonephila inaurata madagascariensis]